jgi:hypothetical protein
VDRPTRHEQAIAILKLRGHRLASEILGRRATNAADFSEAFNVEHIDLIAAIPDEEALLRLGRNIVGPRDGLYILLADGTYRVYTQEKGEAREEIRGEFDAARDAAIDALLQLGGLPYVPAGSRRSGSR